jgi:hypothetical protein
MADASELIDLAPLQDRDLLLRLSIYFDAFEQRLRQGQGWFIFNASSGRSSRISTFIQHRLAEHGASISAYMVPWRDFAISAYVNEVGLPELVPEADGNFPDPAKKHGYEVARHVTADTREKLIFSDLLVLTGLKPHHWHEATFLDRTIDARYQKRLATILVTPDMPTELEAEFESVDPSGTFWPRLFGRMYETSLVAL